MDREAITQKMKTLYAKSRDARAKGNRALARSFKAGAARLRRQLLADAVRQKGQPKAKEATESAG